MKILQSSWFWFFCFTLIFLLSLDFWSWEQQVSFTWLYLPTWLFYLLGLQLVLIIALLVFSLTFWKTLSK
ncbi:MAG: hypothetical protein F6K41_20795 [Symploca sp. SIO3E6]|nr:hypothetical protein [Caldora sp. SIO3E6]